MGKNFIHGNRWKKEKGLTLVETIVSLTIFLVVSLSTVSLAVYTVNSFKMVDIKAFFIREIDTIATFYLDYNDTDFSSAFEYYTGQEINGYTNKTFYFNDKYEYISSNGYSYYMSLKFDSNKLTISSFKSSGKDIYERVVNK